MKAVFLFPGQSSRYHEMVDHALAWAPEETRRVFEEAADLVHRDLLHHFRRDNVHAFDKNSDVQLGVFLTSHAHLCGLAREGITADMSLGLSLGEYNHLVHIGALDFSDAVRLVAARGAAYDEGPRGAMASVLPVPLDELEPIVERARVHGALEIVNLNTPTQQVIAGTTDAVEAAVELVHEELSGHCVLIEKRVPMHASIFRPASDAFRPALDAAPFEKPRLPYLPNVLGRFEPDATPARIRDLLARHVYSPVLWRASVEMIAAKHPGIAFVEVGPKSVLYNMFKKWLSVPRYRTDAPDDPTAGVKSLVEELVRAA